MPVPFTRAAPANPAMAFGQQGRVANDVASGFQIGSAIGGGIRQKRDERRRQREVDRILSKIQLGTSVDDLPDPKMVKALGQVAGPEFANQWLEVSTQLKGMGDAKRAQAQQDLRSQSQFEMSVFESLLQVPEEERANFYSEMMTRYVKNPDSQEMALNSMQSFLGPAMKGDMPDFSDGKLNAYLTQQRYFLDGIKIMQDTRDMTAREREIAAEGGEARANMEMQQGFDREQNALDRGFDREQNALDRENRIEVAKIQAEARWGASGGGVIGRRPDETADQHAERMAQIYGGSPGDFYTFFYKEGLLQALSNNDGDIIGMINPMGKELDLGTFFDKRWKALGDDDPMKQFMDGGSGRSGGGQMSRNNDNNNENSQTIRRRDWLKSMGQ